MKTKFSRAVNSASSSTRNQTKPNFSMKPANHHICLICIAMACLSGCASTPSQHDIQTPAGTPRSEARVRFYGNNGKGVTFFEKKSCVPKDNEGGIRVAGTLGQSFQALFLINQDKSIGMPLSQRTNKRRDGLMSKEFFTEHAVRGGEPITVQLGVTGMPMGPTPGMIVLGAPSGCSAAAVTFVPETGQDYEVDLNFQGSLNRCVVAVSHLSPDGEVSPRPAELAPPCE